MIYNFFNIKFQTDKKQIRSDRNSNKGNICDWGEETFATKRHKETFKEIKKFLYLDLNDDYNYTYIHKMPQNVHLRFANFSICKFYLRRK